MPKLYMDIETRSTVDLKKSGVYVYAESPSTEIIVWAYALDDGKMQFYYPVFKQPFPKDLKESLLNPDTIFVAHNAGFERILLTLVGIRFIPVAAHKEIRKIERWSCTAARARSCALPGALDNVAHALQLPVKKDKEGYTLMMRMCKPNGLDMEGKAVFYGNDADILRLGEYCGVDTEVERLVDKRLPMLSPDQNAVWILTEKMNDRGINVDDNFLMRLMALTEDAVLDLNTRIYKMTDGAVSKVTKVAELKAWLESQGIEDLDGVGKDVILNLIEDPDVKAELKEVLCIRRDGGKSSTAKLKSIAGRMNSDKRIRGTLIFSGASRSGRWTSTGAQLTNVPRNKTFEYLEDVISPLLEGSMTIEDVQRDFGAPLVVVSELLRPIFTGRKGFWIARGDYSQIEARGLQWLAGAQNALDAYISYDNGTGPDLYTVVAADMLGLSYEQVTKEQRQTGKVASLSCGYQGGKKAFLNFSKIYHFNVTEEDADRYKNKWREANPLVVDFWYAAERAAFECLQSAPGTICEIKSTKGENKIRPGMHFKRNADCMVLKLLSGRHLFFWYPCIEEKLMPWGDMKPCIRFYSENKVSRKWDKDYLYGGVIVALITQATCTRDIMANALLTMEERNLSPVLCGHDEGTCEVPKNLYNRQEAAKAVEDAMRAMPKWCEGLPINVEASADDRYMKVEMSK